MCKIEERKMTTENNHCLMRGAALRKFALMVAFTTCALLPSVAWAADDSCRA